MSSGFCVYLFIYFLVVVVGGGGVLQMGEKYLGKILLELKYFNLNISMIIDLPHRAPFITLDRPALASVS